MRFGFNRRIAAVALHDIVMAALAFELAVWLRYLTYGVPQEFFYLWHGTALFALVCSVVFWRVGLYRGIWHYASLTDLKAIARAVTLAALIFLPLLFVLDRLENFPRSALLIIWPLLIILLSGPRLLYRIAKDGHFGAVLERAESQRVPVLLVGAGDEAESFIREMERSELAGYRVVGVIDHKSSRIGRDIHGIRVLGGLADVESVVAGLAARNRKPQRLILATQKLDGVNLDVLPVRSVPSNPSELLASPEMRKLTEEVATRYDRVILDTPACLGLPDAKSVSELCDGLVMVVRAGATPREEVQAALDILDRRKVVGLVLNGSEASREQYGYY